MCASKCTCQFFSSAFRENYIVLSFQRRNLKRNRDTDEKKMHQNVDIVIRNEFGEKKM